MMIYFVTYDLHQAGRDYPRVEALLKKANSWAHPMGSVWFIQSDLTASQWIDQLQKVVDPNDEVFVERMKGEWASLRLNQDVVKWLDDPERQW